MTLPAAVLWDCDGTLADTEPLWGDIESEVLTALGGTPSAETRAITLGASMERTAEILIAAAGRTDLAPAEISELLTVTAAERLRQTEISFMPGAVALLTEISEAGIPLGLVSAADTRVLDAVLSRLPRSFFDVVIGGDSVTVGKPDPEGYLMAARTLGVDPADCLVIEDTPTGARAGNASGAWVLAVPVEAEVPEAERRTFVGSLADVTLADLPGLMRPARDATSGVDR